MIKLKNGRVGKKLVTILYTPVIKMTSFDCSFMHFISNHQDERKLGKRMREEVIEFKNNLGTFVGSVISTSGVTPYAPKTSQWAEMLDSEAKIPGLSY